MVLKQLSIWFLFFVISVNAQESFSILGKVFDAETNTIQVGDILLLEAQSKSLVKYTTLVEGAFALEEVTSGNYILEIRALGFSPYQTNLLMTQNRELSIVLEESTEELEEVEVVAAKNPIEYNSGNLKANVQNPYFSSIPDPFDLLSRLPGIQIGTDRESISILGKGTPLIYLGNQRISIEEFSALPIDGIETLEIINNPSAKYEAEGRAVLLVRLKRNANLGLQGSIQETASQKRNFNNFLTLNSSYAHKNWTFRGNLGYNQLLQWESNSFLFEIPEREVLVDYLVLILRNVRVQWNPGLGFYHQWNDTDYISLNASARLQTDNAPFFTDTFISDRGNENFIVTNTKNDNSKDYYSASFNYNKKLTNSWNLFTGLQYSGFRQVLDSELRNSIDDSPFTFDETREQEYSINALAFRFDIEKVLSENVKWEWGANISRAKADAFTEIEELTANSSTQIDFDYEEELYAGYSSLSGKLDKKIDFELGLRVEYNKVNGTVATEDIPVISRANTNTFPKANFTFEIDSSKTLSMNYGRSIRRPDFSRASSITVFINPFLEGSGNVNLRPTLTDELSVNYQMGKKSLFVTAYQSTNPTNFTISYDEAMDTAILSLVNLEKEIGFYSGVTLPYTKGIWTSNSTVTLNYNQLKNSSALLSSANPFLYVYTNHQFKIAKDTTLALGAWAMGKRQEGIFQRNSMVFLETSISKTFFKNWDCTLRFNDITRGTNFEERYAIGGGIADGIYFSDLKEVALSLKYRFGNTEKAKFKNRDVDDNLERIN
jgi:hypothetical protein